MWVRGNRCKVQGGREGTREVDGVSLASSAFEINSLTTNKFLPPGRYMKYASNKSILAHSLFLNGKCCLSKCQGGSSALRRECFTEIRTREHVAMCLKMTMK